VACFESLGWKNKRKSLYARSKIFPWGFHTASGESSLNRCPFRSQGLVPFPLATLPPHLGIIGIAAIDIVLIEVVVIPIKFGLSAFVPVFVLYIATVDVVAAIVVIVVVVALSSNTFIPVFALYIAAVHVGKGGGGKREYQCECNQNGSHSGESSIQFQFSEWRSSVAGDSG
jgi:hypothetical protein